MKGVITQQLEVVRRPEQRETEGRSFRSGCSRERKYVHVCACVCACVQVSEASLLEGRV